MRNFLYITLLSIIVTSCVPGSEQTDQTKDLEDFLMMVEDCLLYTSDAADE